MNTYEYLVLAIDIIHFLIILVFLVLYLWTVSFTPRNRYLRFKTFCAIFWPVVIVLQILCGMRCPLVVLQGHLLELAHPGTVEGSWVYDPFIVTTLREYFGLSVPEVAVTILGFVLAGLSIMVLLTHRSLKKQRRKELANSET